MARARTIKPHFLHSSTMNQVSVGAQLTFIRLWLLVDDAGRAVGRPRYLEAHLYSDPSSRASLPGWLDELERVGCIARYTVDGDPYVRVVNWRKHQRISHPTPSKLPADPGRSRQDTPEGLATYSGTGLEPVVKETMEVPPARDRMAVLTNSGAPQEALAKKPAEFARHRRLGAIHERLASFFSSSGDRA
jgi:hypothetical protein